VIFPFNTVFRLLISLPYIPIAFVFDVDIFKLFFFAILFKWYVYTQ
jgi:hypothetical protein